MSIKVLLITPYSFLKYWVVQNHVNLIEEFLTSHEKYNLFGYIFKAIKDNRSLYFKRIGTVVLLVAFALI